MLCILSSKAERLILMLSTKCGNMQVSDIKTESFRGKKGKELPLGHESESPACSLRYDGPMNG